MADIDKLEIEIEASSSDTEAKINALNTALKDLKSTLGGTWKNPVRDFQRGTRGGTTRQQPQQQQAEFSGTRRVESQTAEVELDNATQRASRLRSEISSVIDSIRQANSLWKEMGKAGSEAAESIKNRFTQVKQAIAVSPFVQKAGSAFESLRDKAGSAFSGLKDKAGSALSGLGGKIKEKLGSLGQGFADVGKSFAQGFKFLGATLAQPIITAVNGITSALGKIAPVASTAFSALGKAAATAGKVVIKALSVVFNIIKKVVSVAASFVKTIGGALVNAAKRAASAVGQFVKAGLHRVFERATSPVRNFTKGLSNVVSSFKRILFYRLIRTVIKQIGDAFKNGVNNVYQWSKAMGGSFAQSMDSAASSMQYFKNSIGAAIAPLISALVPALNVAVNAVVSLIEALSRLFAILGGRGTYTKAVKANTEFAESAGGAAKAAKDFTLGIDELNVINDSSGGGGGGANADYGNMFEDVDVDSVQFDTLGDKFNYFLDVILSGVPKLKEGLFSAADSLNQFNERLYEAFKADGILFKIQKLGGDIANALNETIKAIQWEQFGKTLGAGLNLGLQFLASFIRTFNWKQVGDSIAQFINGAVSEINFTAYGELMFAKFKIAIEVLAGLILGLNAPQLAKAASNIVIGFFNSMTNTIQSIPWAQIGQKISDFLVNIDWVGIAEAVAESFNSIIHALHEIVINIDWATMALNFVTGLNTLIQDIDWDETGQTFADSFDGVLEFLETAAANFNWAGLGKSIGDAIVNINWGEMFLDLLEVGVYLIGGLLEGILSVFDSIAQWIKENVFDPFVNAIKNFFGIHSPSTVMSEIGEFVVKGFMKGLEFFSKVTGKIKEWSKKVVDWFTGGDGKGNIIEKFKNAASNVVSGFKEKISGTYETVKSSVTTWASGVHDWFTNFGGGLVNKFKTAAGDLISGFGDKVSATYETTKSNISTWAGALKGWFEEGGGGSDGFYNVARNLIDGFKNGIGDLYQNAKSAITTWASSVENWFKEKLGIASPSKVFYGFGENTVEGYNNAVEAEGKGTKSIVDKWMESFAGAQPDFDFDTESLKQQFEEQILPVLEIVKQIADGADIIVAETLKIFKDAAKEATNVMLKMRNDSINAISSITAALNSIPRNITTVHTIITQTVSGGESMSTSKFAAGGFPETGQMFIAREAGPELVGTIGGKTAVANNNQIEAGIARGMENANEEQNALLRQQNELLAAILAKTGTFSLDGKTVKTMYDRANRQAGASIMTGGVFA